MIRGTVRQREENRMSEIQKRVDRNKRIMATLTGVLARIEANRGKEGYRHSYDQALHINVALHDAGLKIVETRKRKQNDERKDGNN